MMADTIVVREDEALTNDVGVVAAVVESPVVLATASLTGGTITEKTKLVEVELEYECDEVQGLFFEYSRDHGENWIDYSYADIEPTVTPRVLAVRQTITGHNLMLRVRATTLGKLRVLALVARTVVESKVTR